MEYFAFPGSIDFAAHNKGAFSCFHRLYNRWITNNFPYKWHRTASKTSGCNSSPRRIFHQTPLEREHRLEIQREQRRRRRHQETWMESQMVQNSRSKIVFTFNKFFIKVKRDFNQAHQNQVTFNGFSFKVTAYFNQAQQQKLTHSTNFNSTPREYCVKLKKWAFLSFNEKFFSVFENHSTSTLKHERRNAGTPERRNTKTRNTKLLKPETHSS